MSEGSSTTNYWKWMFYFQMMVKSSFGSLIVTMITSILNTFMFRLNMSCHIIMSCKLLVTLITSILGTFMSGLNMSCQMMVMCSLVVTLITRHLIYYIIKSNAQVTIYNDENFSIHLLFIHFHIESYYK